MGMELDLEPLWNHVCVDQRCDVLVEIVVWDPQGKHLGKTAIAGRLVKLVGVIPQCSFVTILGGRMTSVGASLAIAVDEGIVLPHQTLDIKDFDKCVDVFSGIGCMGTGLDVCYQVVASVDWAQPFCAFLQRQTTRTVIQGDLGAADTLRRLFDASKGSVMIAGGFSCQPWSALGDRFGTGDSRSSSLRHVLRAVHFLRAHSAVLECVIGAGKDPEVLSTIQGFCKQTGYSYNTIELALEDLLPARRNRWWCTIASPIVQPFRLRALPKLTRPPVVFDLLPQVPIWPEPDMMLLRLDRYDSGKFEAYGSIQTKLVVGDKPMATALHGWSNQLTACPCGCRQHAMSEHRLKSKGLHGALFLTEGCFESSYATLPCTRHAHPIEIALCHGMRIDLDFWPHLRLAICGLGQMAAPSQATWVSSQLKMHLAQALDESWKSPEQALMEQMGTFFESVRLVMPSIHAHANFQAYIGEVQGLLQVSHATHAGPLPWPPACFDEPKNDNSQRRGRQDLQTSQENTKQPAEGMQGPHEKMTKQPVTETPGLEKQPAVEPPGLQQEPEGHHLPTPAPAMPALPYESAGPTHSPDMIACTDDVYMIHDDMSILDAVVNEPLIACDQVCDAAQCQPSHLHGGIPAFAWNEPPVTPVKLERAVKTEVCEQPLADPPVTQVDEVTTPCSATSVVGEHEACTPGSFTQDLASAIHFLDRDQFAEATPQDDHMPTDVTMPETPVDQTPQPGHFIQLFYPNQIKPTFVKVQSDTTVGSIVVAEKAMGSLDTPVYAIQHTDSLGCYLRLGSTTTPFQQIFLRDLPSVDQPGVPEGVLPTALQSGQVFTRVEVLRQQQAWVAADEMAHYLTMLAQTGVVTDVPPCVLPPFFEDEELIAMLHKWANECCLRLQSSTRVVTALLAHNHWFPVFFLAGPMGIHVATTPGGKDWIDIALRNIPNTTCTGEVHAMTAFPNDCGFQTIAWLVTIAFADEWPTPSTVSSTFTPTNAVAWRCLFEHHLNVSGCATSLHRPCEMRFGGGVPDVPTALRTLLQEKGVPSDQVAARADVVLEKLGRSRVGQLLRGPSPWRDIKAAANAQTPKLQLVLASELEVAIKTRLKDPLPFGDKKTKRKAPQKSKDVPIQLLPGDIAIPDGIFKEGADVGLKQIKLGDIGPSSRGIVVATTHEAAPYLKIAKPVSSAGLAMIILDKSNDFLVGVGNEVRFPAICTCTSEPVLVTARLVQLGSIEVSRNLAPAAPRLEEVSNAVIKILVFRDELQEIPWRTFAAQPVKFVKQQVPVLQPPEVILDCWDRQFLTIRMTKSKADEADVYTFCLRVTGIQCDDLLASSGTSAIYFEPRTVDGRNHAPEFRVVWMNKQDKQTVAIAKQGLTEWAGLVRAGNRFGLRVQLTDAKAVHAKLKPGQPFMENDAVLEYIIGPMPFGATRATIQKVFSQWQWNAKPTQPKGRSADGRGILWTVIASQAPPLGVFQMEHMQ